MQVFITNIKLAVEHLATNWFYKKSGLLRLTQLLNCYVSLGTVSIVNTSRSRRVILKGRSANQNLVLTNTINIRPNSNILLNRYYFSGKSKLLVFFFSSVKCQMFLFLFFHWFLCGQVFYYRHIDTIQKMRQGHRLVLLYS